MKKNWILALGVAVLALGIFGILKVNKDKKQRELIRLEEESQRIESLTQEELKEIVGYLLAQDEKRWVEVREVEEDSYFYRAESLDLLKLPETKHLSVGREGDGEGDVITFLDSKDKLRLTIKTEYYFAPKLSILIDDVGMNTGTADAFGKIDEEITFATIPFLPKSREATKKLREMGYKVMLHMPMAGSNDALNRRTEGMLLPDMSKKEIYNRFDRAIESVGEVDGFNNHMGSRFTANEDKMREILEYAKEKGMYYVDSNTAIKNMGYPVALELGVPTYYCSHFLDNSRKMADMKKEIRRSVDQSKRDGRALVIGHYHKGMARAIEESLPYIKDQGVRLVFSTSLLEK